MADIEADVVIVGAGLIGGMMAWDLQRRGLKVAMIDSGPPVDRIEAVIRFKESPEKTGNSPYEEMPWAPVPGVKNPFDYYVQPEREATDPFRQVPFTGQYLRQVGGTSWHFTGHAERMYPNDFRLKSAYGRGLDWPISYETLEPFYAEVERQWGVAGNDTCVAPTNHPYPLPYVPLSYLDEQVNKAAQKLKDGIGPLPHCRASVGYPGTGRAQCCGNASCRFICPTGAKYDGSVHVNMAIDEGAKLFSNCVVYKVEVGADRTVQTLRYRDFSDPKNPVEGTAVGKRVVIAAHGIEAPRLLLMSKGEYSPNGVANSSDQVGRNLMSFMGLTAKAYVTEPVYPYRGPVNATGTFRELRDGSFRKDFASIETIVVNGGFDPTNGPLNEATEAVDAGLFGSDLRNRVRDRTVRQVFLDNSVEVLPDRDNRVTLAEETTAMGLPRPKINFRIDNYTHKGIFVSWKRAVEVLHAMGGTLPEGLPKPTQRGFKEAIKRAGGRLETGAAMIAGTTRMGKAPKTSVVDEWGRSHDHSNLFIVGTGNYVTGGSVSPSLTATAIGLRAAGHIADTFRE